MNFLEHARLPPTAPHEILPPGKEPLQNLSACLAFFFPSNPSIFGTCLKGAKLIIQHKQNETIGDKKHHIVNPGQASFSFVALHGFL